MRRLSTHSVSLKDVPPSRSETAVRGRRHSRHWLIMASGGALVAIVAVALGVAGWLWHRLSHATAPEAALTAVPLTSYPGNEEPPSFSPDGTQVAFSWKGEGQGNSDIYAKLIGVEPPLRLTTNPAQENSPAWFPDGRWIAFLRVLPALKASVILSSHRGGPGRVLTEIYFDPINFDGPFLTLSADSRWLAMVDVDKPFKAVALFLYSVETSEKQRPMDPLRFRITNTGHLQSAGRRWTGGASEDQRWLRAA